MPDYTVKQGDCISSIADQHGFFWQTVWNHANNAGLRAKRQNPNVLYAGDVVYVPDKGQKDDGGPTEMCHKFRKKGVPAKLRLIIEEDDEPLANEPYVLLVGDQRIEGTTDAKGFLKESIPPDATEATLSVGDIEYELELGTIDPLDEVAGVQERLQNLGFYEGPLDDVMGPQTAGAVATFQEAVGLRPTGMLDGVTRQKLFDWQDQKHQAPTGSGAQTGSQASGGPADSEDWLPPGIWEDLPDAGGAEV